MSALVLQKGQSVDDVKEVLKKTRQKYSGNTGMVDIASYNSVSTNSPVQLEGHVLINLF